MISATPKSLSDYDMRALHSTSGTSVHLEHEDRRLQANHASMRTLQTSHEADADVSTAGQRHPLFLLVTILGTTILICAVLMLTVAVYYVLGTTSSGSVPWVSLAYAFSFLMQRANRKECSSSIGTNHPNDTHSYEELEMAEWQREVETFGRTYDSSPLFLK